MVMSDNETVFLRKVYFLSNRTAITAETLGQSLLAQFPDIHFATQTVPYVDTLAKAEKLAECIALENKNAPLKPIIISTLASVEISHVMKKLDAIYLDPFDRFLPDLENLLHAHSIHESGQSHRIGNQSIYELRMKAIDFSVLHDDGLSTRQYDEADIIVIGVSRSGKTPTCLYLALQYGLKAANYPITEEDMESESLPESIQAYGDKLFGFSTTPERLAHMREQRRRNSRYASLPQCRFEIRAAEQMFRDYRIPYINTSSMSIEEIATKVVEVFGLKRISHPSITHL